MAIVVYAFFLHFTFCILKIWFVYFHEIYQLMNHDFIVADRFVCPSDPGGYVVWGLLPPDRVSQCKLVLSKGPDKERFQ